MSKKLYIPVGSGYLYYMSFTGTVPADSVIETDDNRLGHIEGGAEISYKPTTKTFKDDFGIVSREKLTAEEAALKASLVAWSSVDMAVFADTARMTESTGSDGRKHRTIKIGGLKNDPVKPYLFRFVHLDPQYGDIRITIVGRSAAEIKLAYKPEDSSNMDLEVTAQSQDEDGTLILFDEALPADGSSSGSGSGGSGGVGG